MGYVSFLFFLTEGLFTALYPTLCIEKKFLYKTSFKFLFIRVTKIHSESVKNESSRTKKIQGGGVEHPSQPV